MAELLVYTSNHPRENISSSLESWGHTTTHVGACAEWEGALSGLVHPIVLLEANADAPERALAHCREIRRVSPTAMVILLVDDPAVLMHFSPQEELYDEFMGRSSPPMELKERIQASIARNLATQSIRERERRRILAQIIDLAQSLDPFLEPQELFRRVGEALMALPEVRGVYAAVRGDAGEMEPSLSLGSLAAPDDDTVRLVLGSAEIQTGHRDGDPLCVVPLGAGPLGLISLRISRPQGFAPALASALAGLISSAYASARLFASTKERQVRLERAYLQRHRELRLLTDRIERLSEMRDIFIATLSHDLRTPLGVIMGNCQIMQEGIAGPLTARQDRSLDAVNRQAARMNDMVEDLLDRYRAGSSPTPASVAAVDLREVARTVAHTFDHIAEDRDIRLEVDCPDDIQTTGDAAAIREVISNLVDNSLKHAEALVGIGIRADSERAIVRVYDDGSGFPEDEVDIQEISSGRSIGLRLCVKMVQKMGGTLRLGNRARGGAVATVTLPLTAARGQSMSILVASAAIDRLEELSEILAVHWEVAGTAYAGEVLSRASEDPPDLLVLDAELKGSLQGLELLAKLKEDPELGAISTIVICPPGAAGLVERAHTLGALAVLESPLDGQELVAHVRRAERLAASAKTGFSGRRHDPLTGLDTGNAIEKKIGRLKEESQLVRSPLPALRLNVVDLTAINRRYGYAAGDQLLLWMAGTVRRQSRPGDVVARVGGDHFLLVMPRLPMTQALRMASDLTELVREARPRLGGTRVNVEVEVDVLDLVRDPTPLESSQQQRG